MFERIVTTLSCGAAASEAAGLERERETVIRSDLRTVTQRMETL